MRESNAVKEKAPGLTREMLVCDGYSWTGNTTDETAKAEITRDYQNQGFDIQWMKGDFIWSYWTRRNGRPLFNPVKAPVKFPLPMGFIYEPGNGTRFDVYLAQHFTGSILVCLLNFGTCHVFGHAPHPSYVAEKLGLPYADAEALTPLIIANLSERVS